MDDSESKAERRERKRRKRKEMAKSGRSFVNAIRQAIRKRLDALKSRET